MPLTHAARPPRPAAPAFALLAGLAASVLGAAAQAAPVRYALDPTHSAVSFEVLHFDTSTLRGRFAMLSGDVTLDREAHRGRAQLVINTASLSTGVPPLDTRLKEPDLFNSSAQPQAWFVAEQLQLDAAGNLGNVRGELTLRGTSAPLELKVLRYRCYTSPLFKREVCGGEFEAELPRSRYGMTFGLPLVADTVRLRISVEAVRQD